MGLSADFIKKLNYPKLAGLEKVLMVDVFPHKVVFSYIRRNDSLLHLSIDKWDGQLTVLAFAEYELDAALSQLHAAITQFLEDNKIELPYTVIGINEFKTTAVPVPADTEDTELWFTENLQKFIPGGKENDFTFAYRKDFTDENSIWFSTVLVRNDLLERMLYNIPVNLIKLMGIYAFPLFMRCNEVADCLYIGLSGHKMFYHYCSPQLPRFSGEDYIEQLSEHYLRNTFLELQNKISSAGKNNRAVQHIFLSADQDASAIAERAARYVFTGSSMNNGFADIPGSAVASALAAQHILASLDALLNLLPEKHYHVYREGIERQLTSRLILAGGIVVFLLLFIVQAAEFGLSAKAESIDEQSTGISSQSMQMEKLKTENNTFRKNLLFLEKLKGHQNRYSPVIKQISLIINNRTCLTNVALREKTETLVTVELTGYAFTQQDVADFISALELNKIFKSVALIHSVRSDGEEIPEEIAMPQTELVKFLLSASYVTN